MRVNLSFRAMRDLTAGIVRWPTSVIRLRGTDTERIVWQRTISLTAWRGYTDKEAFSFSVKQMEHRNNTINPIAENA